MWQKNAECAAKKAKPMQKPALFFVDNVWIVVNFFALFAPVVFIFSFPQNK
jgi:hypothetical protein